MVISTQTTCSGIARNAGKSSAVQAGLVFFAASLQGLDGLTQATEDGIATSAGVTMKLAHKRPESEVVRSPVLSQGCDPAICRRIDGGLRRRGMKGASIIAVTGADGGLGAHAPGAEAAPCRRITQAPAQAPGQEALVMQLLEETLNKN
eukprot:symbB.v1.2.036990.t1/scaffold5349.1/size28207/2